MLLYGMLSRLIMRKIVRIAQRDVGVLRRQLARAGVADDGLSYALYGHPNINVENVSGSMMVVSTEQPGLSVMVDYRSGIWVVQPFAHDESFGSAIQFGERLAPVEAGLLRPNVYQHFFGGETCV